MKYGAGCLSVAYAIPTKFRKSTVGGSESITGRACRIRTHVIMHIYDDALSQYTAHARNPESQR